MDIAKISIKGQVTIPIEIRKKLGLKEGDKVIFMEKGENIILMNSNRLAFEEYGRGMSDAAEQAGISSEQDVIDLVNQVRRKTWEDAHENNA